MTFNCGQQSFITGFIVFIVTFLMIFLIIFLIYYFFIEDTLRDFRNAFNRICETAPAIEYHGTVIHVPQENGKYERSLSLALFFIGTAASISNCPGRTPFPLPPELPEAYSLSGPDPSDGITRGFGYIFYNPDKKWAVIAFSGTIFYDEFLDDINYAQVKPTKLNNYIENGSLVHKGFYDVYLVIQDQIKDWLSKHAFDELFITGHSMGAALSYLCAFDLGNIFSTGPDPNKKPIHYTFASPRMANSIFVIQGFSKNGVMDGLSLRINNTEDIIPALPPAGIGSWKYEHPNIGNVPFTATDASPSASALDVLINNHTTQYAISMPFCIGSNVTPSTVGTCHV